MTETRMEKAQRLVDEGRIQLKYHDFGVEAHISEKNAHYDTVLYSDGSCWCGCPKSLSRGVHTDDFCVHVLAVQLAMERKNIPVIDVSAKSEICQKCGGPIRFVWHAPDSLWRDVTGFKDGNGSSPGVGHLSLGKHPVFTPSMSSPLAAITAPVTGVLCMECFENLVRERLHTFLYWSCDVRLYPRHALFLRLRHWLRRLSIEK